MKNGNYKFKLESKYIAVLFGLVFFFTNVIGERYNTKSNQITGIAILLLSSYLIWLVRKNISLIVVSTCIWYFNYSIVIRRYIINVPSKLYPQITSTEIYGIGINILLLFIIFILVFLPTHGVKEYTNNHGFIEFETGSSNVPIILSISIVLVLIFMFGFTRPDVVGERGTPSALYEYSIIFFIIGCSYIGRNRLNKYLIIFLLICFAGQNLIYGGRITALQLMIVLYLIFCISKLSIFKTVTIAVSCFILMTCIGIYRGAWIGERDLLSNVIMQIKETMFTLDTADSAYFTSLTFLHVRDIWDTQQIWEQFKCFLQSMLLGGGVQNSNLAILTRQYIVHYFGGVLPFFFYFWFGWVGVIISAGLVSYFMNILNNINLKSSKYTKLLGVYFICTTPRWYLYSPTPLIRGVMLFTLVYYICMGIDVLLRKAVRKNY